VNDGAPRRRDALAGPTVRVVAHSHRVPTAAELGIDLGTIPEPVQQPAEIAAQVTYGVGRGTRWGETPCLVIALWTDRANNRYNERADARSEGVTASVQHLSPGVEGAFDPAYELRLLTDGGRITVPAGKAFLGLGVLAEELTIDESISPADYWRGTPQEVADRHDDWVSAGRSRQARVVVAALTTGWRFQYCAPRHAAPLLAVHAPGEPWTEAHALAVTVTDATQTLASTAVYADAAQS
jgi:hypothetical protein